LPGAVARKAASLSDAASERFLLEDFARPGVEVELARLERLDAFADIRARLLAEGRAQGRAEAAAEREALVAGPLGALARLVAGLTAERAAFQREHERELLRLAFAVAHRLLRAELRSNPAVVEGKLRELLGLLEQAASYRVLVNPADLAAASALLAAEGRSLFGDLPWALKPDPRLPAGAVALEGDAARLESICADELVRLEQQLEAELLAAEAEHGA
jgi:flagellar assembly protein FliH